MVRYQLVNLFPGAPNDGQPLSQGRFESHGASHGFTSPDGEMDEEGEVGELGHCKGDS